MNIKLSVQKIWEERINQRIDSSFILLGELKEFYGLKLNEDFAFTKLQIHPEELCEILAIESSLARSRRNTKLSEACHERLENEISLKIRLLSFTYQFEKALSLYVKSWWIEAISHFLKSYQLAEKDLAKAACLLNLILCYENLEISFTQSLIDLKSLLKNLDGELIQGIHSQIQSLELRMKWRASDFKKNDFTDIENSEISQISYFLVYLKQIPYLTDPSTEQQIEFFAKQKGHLFNKDFRLRTLTYQISNSDKDSGRLSDYIERIYLWTWKWIENPLKYNINYLVQTVQDFPWDELARAEQLSLDDQSLFILSLGWLSYFDHNFKAIYKQATKKFKFSTHNVSLMNEKQFQDALANNTDLALLKINEDLKFRMAELLKLRGRDDKSELIHTSDLVQLQISSQTVQAKSGKLIHSKSLCTALKILKENENISVESFYNQTLSPVEYDHYLHAAHISNILYKLNQIIRYELCVKQKNGVIYLEGSKHFIQINYGDLRSEMLLQNRTWTQLTQALRNKLSLVENMKKNSKKKQFIEISNQFNLFSRSQLQTHLKLSKTDSNRLLNSWLEQKWISKKGFGKNTLYSINKSLQESA